MRVLATFLLMMSLLAMSVTVAAADIARPSCGSQVRAGDMCYAAALPASNAETVVKPGLCLVCLVPADAAVDPVRRGSLSEAAFGSARLASAGWTAFWRPPRV